MLHRVKGTRRKRDRQAFQGPGLDGVGADARGQNGGTGTREDGGENRLIGRQFDGDIQFAVRGAERVQSLDEGRSCPGAVLPQDPFARD